MEHFTYKWASPHSGHTHVKPNTLEDTRKRAASMLGKFFPRGGGRREAVKIDKVYIFKLVEVLELPTEPQPITTDAWKFLRRTTEERAAKQAEAERADREAMEQREKVAAVYEAEADRYQKLADEARDLLGLNRQGTAYKGD